MRLEVTGRHGNITFIVHAETEVDRAVLSLVTSEEYMKGRTLRMGGSTYSCDVNQVIAFNFSWVKNP